MKDEFFAWLDENNCQIFTDENFDIVAVEENGEVTDTPKDLVRWLWRKFLEWLEQ